MGDITNKAPGGRPPRHARSVNSGSPGLQLVVEKVSCVYYEDAKKHEMILRQKSRKMTPEAKAFIIRLILEGYPNQTINHMLRSYKYLSPGAPDLSHDALWRIRRLKEAQPDVSLLSLEAQQVAHNSMSSMVCDWSNLMHLAYQALTTNEKGDGLIFDSRTKVSELIAIISEGSKFMRSWFATDIANYSLPVSEAQSSADGECGQSESIRRILAAILLDRNVSERQNVEDAGIPAEAAPSDFQGIGTLLPADWFTAQTGQLREAV